MLLEPGRGSLSRAEEMPDAADVGRDCLATGEQPSELKQELELLVLLDHGYRSSDILFLHLLTLRRWLLVASDWINGHSRSDRGSWQVAVRRCRESRMAPRVAIF